jgi:hypothetical protein
MYSYGKYTVRPSSWNFMVYRGEAERERGRKETPQREGGGDPSGGECCGKIGTIGGL